MMMTLQGQDPFYARFLADHRELNRMVEAVEHQLVSARDNSEARAALPGMLNDLLAHVRHHFEEEEQGGVLEEAMCRLPRLCSQATTVERQHAPLLAQLEQIVQRLQPLGESAEKCRSLADEFCRFAAALRTHEAAENRIAAEAFASGARR
jgi:hypothetical protein